VRRKEKFIASIITIALGVLLIALKGVTVQIVTSVFGVMLIVWGVLDIVSREMLLGAIKCIFGMFILSFGWLILSIVLYLISILLLIIAVWWVCELWRVRCVRCFCLTSFLLYAQPILLALVGVFLFFHQEEGRDWLFVLAGIFSVMEGSIMFADSIQTIE
jgi:hypothetical protein